MLLFDYSADLCWKSWFCSGPSIVCLFICQLVFHGAYPFIFSMECTLSLFVLLWVYAIFCLYDLIVGLVLVILVIIRSSAQINLVCVLLGLSVVSIKFAF